MKQNIPIEKKIRKLYKDIKKLVEFEKKNQHKSNLNLICRNLENEKNKTKKWLWAEKYFLKKEFFSLKFQLPLCDRIFQKY